ncbi:MAG: ABC transporter permease [Pseudomonadales bacterium]
MKAFFAIFKARNIEYYRDKGSLAWAFIFPLLVIIGCAVAFSTPDNAVFKIGIHGETASFDPIELLQQPYIKTVEFDDLSKALQRIKYHQLDLLISIDAGVSQQPQQPSTQQSRAQQSSAKRYWINTESTSSKAAEQLFLASHHNFAKQLVSGRKVRYVDWVIPGVLGMNLMFGALFGVGYVIVRYRQNGVLKRLQATPVSAIQFLSAQLASRLVIVVLVNGLIFIGCKLFLDLIVLGSYFNLLLITVLGGLSMISVSLLISCRTANEELAGGLLNVATWPMLFLSEVWFSLDNSPLWLQTLANLMPLTHIVKAARTVMIDGATLLEVSYHLIWLVALTIICIGLAAGLFRWTKNT